MCCKDEWSDPSGTVPIDYSDDLSFAAEFFYSLPLFSRFMRLSGLSTSDADKSSGLPVGFPVDLRRRIYAMYTLSLTAISIRYSTCSTDLRRLGRLGHARVLLCWILLEVNRKTSSPSSTRPFRHCRLCTPHQRRIV